MTQASVRLRRYGTISGAVLTRARLPIARIFGEIPAAAELGLVVPAGQSQRAKGPVDLRATRKLSQQNHVSDKSASGKSGTINALAERFAGHSSHSLKLALMKGRVPIPTQHALHGGSRPLFPKHPKRVSHSDCLGVKQKR